MTRKNRVPTHPGEILLKEFLEPMEITQVRFAEHLGVSLQRVNEIVNGKRGVTVETALMFGKAFKTSPEFWMNLQNQHDLARVRLDKDIRPLVR